MAWSSMITSLAHRQAATIVPEINRREVIAGSNTFEALFSNLESMRYVGYNEEDGKQIRYKETIAIIFNCLDRFWLWRGKIVKVGDYGKKMICEFEDSKVKIPPHLIKDPHFIMEFAEWNELLASSIWPYPNVPEEYGLRDKVKALIDADADRIIMVVPRKP